MPDTLNDKIAADLKVALREGDETRKLTLRGLRAALMRAADTKRAAAIDAERKRRGGTLGEADVVLDPAALALTEDESVSVVQREVKQRRESIAEFTKANRTDLIASEEAELAILQTYLPRQLSRDEVEAEARTVIAEVAATGPAQSGKVMKALMPRLRGQADGKIVSDVVRTLLSAEH